MAHLSAMVVFNLRQLRPTKKTSTIMFFDLQYADDAAYPSVHYDSLQRNIDIMYRTYGIAGK